MSPTQAVLDGLRRGAAMAINPDTTRLRELSEEAQSINYTAEAWKSVGESLRAAMGTVNQSKGHSQD